MAATESLCSFIKNDFEVFLKSKLLLWRLNYLRIFSEHQALVKSFNIDLINEPNQKLLDTRKHQMIKTEFRKLSINNCYVEDDL